MLTPEAREALSSLRRMIEMCPDRATLTATLHIPGAEAERFLLEMTLDELAHTIVTLTITIPGDAGGGES
jgi:hypothetical protein